MGTQVWWRPLVQAGLVLVAVGLLLVFVAASMVWDLVVEGTRRVGWLS